MLDYARLVVIVKQGLERDVEALENLCVSGASM
jgi:hypothetical protein